MERPSINYPFELDLGDFPFNDIVNNYSMRYPHEYFKDNITLTELFAKLDSIDKKAEVNLNDYV